jgi:hypothetical protein
MSKASLLIVVLAGVLVATAVAAVPSSGVQAALQNVLGGNTRSGTSNQQKAFDQAVVADLQDVQAQLNALDARLDALEGVPPPPPSNLRFADEFNGPVGPPDPAKWLDISGGCNIFGRPCSVANSFLDGNGHLVQRITRSGSNFIGAFIAGFSWDGHPASTVKHFATTPFRVELRAKMPPVAGAWGGGWTNDPFAAPSQPNEELDFAEERMSLPTQYGAHKHVWTYQNGWVDIAPWDCNVNGVPDLSASFHVYVAEIRASGVTFSMDGIVCGVAPGVADGQRLSFLLDQVVGLPGSWGSGGRQPAATDPGPWDAVYDYIRVEGL